MNKLVSVIGPSCARVLAANGPQVSASSKGTLGHVGCGGPVVVLVVVEADLWLWWSIEGLGDAEKSAPSNLPPYIQKKSFLGWFNK